MNVTATSNSLPPRFVPREFGATDAGTTRRQVSSAPVQASARRTLRTVSTLFHDDGRLGGAKVDLHTGEVVAHQYKDYFEQGPKARLDPKAPDCEPFWMHMPAAMRSTGQSRHHDSSLCKRFNPVKMYLDGYLCLSDAAEDLPLLRDAIESANLLDLGGSTRPLNSGLLFGMLQYLDLITPQTVMEYMGCGIRHAQKVALCLRVIVNAFEKTADGKLSTATYTTPPKKRAVRERGPCKPEAEPKPDRMNMRKHGTEKQCQPKLLVA